MIEYFFTNQHTAWFVLGFILLAIELLVFGFATGFILFVGLGALITGSFVWFGIIEHTWISGIACFGISSAIISAILYLPLKKLQNNSDVLEKDTSSDIIGLEFRLAQDISVADPGTTHYSGVDWKVEIDKDSGINEISKGSLVAVVTVDVALFRVKPIVESE